MLKSTITSTGIKLNFEKKVGNPIMLMILKCDALRFSISCVSNLLNQVSRKFY